MGSAGGGEGGGQTGDVQSCRFGRLRLTGQGRERENGREAGKKQRLIMETLNAAREEVVVAVM